MKVRKAVIPAAGLGTRFLPASKAQPKEMVPVVDKPAIQYVVEEAVGAGLDDILIVIGRGKYAIEDHFDRSWELEGLLEDKGDKDRLQQVRSISDMAEIHYIRQLGDDLIGEEETLLADLVDCFNRQQTSVIAAQEVERSQIGAYGVVAPGEEVEPGVVRLTDIVEKPEPEEAPSNLAVIGRYVLHPEIFAALRVTEPGAKGEIQLSDALKRLVHKPDARGALAMRFVGRRYDVGEKNGYLRATVELAANRPDVGPSFVQFLREFVAGL